MRAVAIDPAAPRRSRKRLSVIADDATVVDPTRGTRVAVAFPAVALALTIGWVALDGADELAGLGPAIALLAVVSALAERISIQLGPRSWYSPTTPVIVLAALIGGPLAGVLVALAGQLGATDTVWRRRAAGAGLGAVQGLVAGIVGLTAATTPAAAIVLAACAMIGGHRDQLRRPVAHPPRPTSLAAARRVAPRRHGRRRRRGDHRPDPRQPPARRPAERAARRDRPRRPPQRARDRATDARDIGRRPRGRAGQRPTRHAHERARTGGPSRRCSSRPMLGSSAATSRRASSSSTSTASSPSTTGSGTAQATSSWWR